jgi:hypothetical protein
MADPKKPNWFDANKYALMGLGTGMLSQATGYNPTMAKGLAAGGQGWMQGAQMQSNMDYRAQQMAYQQQQAELAKAKAVMAQKQADAIEAQAKKFDEMGDHQSAAALRAGDTSVIKPKMTGSPQAMTLPDGRVIMVQTDVYGSPRALPFGPFKPGTVDLGNQVITANLAQPGASYKKGMAPGEAERLAIARSNMYLNAMNKQMPKYTPVLGVDPQTGQQVTQFVDMNALNRGASVSQATLPGGGMPREPLKPLPTQAQAALGSGLMNLDAMSKIDPKKLEKYTGPGAVFGTLGAWAGNKDAADLYTKLDTMRANVQALVRGIPSNFDQLIFQALAPGKWVPGGINKSRMESFRDMNKTAVQEAMAYYMGQGYKVPKPVLDKAKDLGVDVGAIRPWTEDYGDPLKKTGQLVSKYYGSTPPTTGGAAGAPMGAPPMGTPPMGASPQPTAAIPRVTSPDDLKNVPIGGHFIDPNGVERVRNR